MSYKISNDTASLNQIIEDNGSWVLLKCSKCGINHIPLINKSKIVPVNKYCKNCGSAKYYIEQKKNIDSYETIYALYLTDIQNYKQGKIRHNFAQLSRALMKNIKTQQNNIEDNQDVKIVSGQVN